MRLIDAERFEELFNQQVELGATDLFDAVEDALQDTESIDSETLPIVQELRKELERVTRERDEITNLCGKLVMICDQPRDKWKEVFQKYNLSMFGDYMGSGYPFVDAFNRIYDEFIETSSDGAYKLVKESAEKEFQSIQSKRKSLEVQKDE